MVLCASAYGQVVVVKGPTDFVLCLPPLAVLEVLLISFVHMSSGMKVAFAAYCTLELIAVLQRAAIPIVEIHNQLHQLLICASMTITWTQVMKWPCLYLYAIESDVDHYRIGCVFHAGCIASKP